MEQAAFDREELLERVGGDEALCEELVMLFLADAPSAIAALRRAIVDKNLDALEREAHALKGAAAYISARSIRELATSLESKARAGRHDEAPSLVMDIEKAVAHLETSAATPVDSPKL